MSEIWKNLTIRSKIIYPIAIVSIISGVISYFYFYDLYKTTEVNALVTKARTLLLEAEAVREYTSEQQKRDVFRDSITALEDFLYTVPIFSAMEVARNKASELDMEFKVPKNQPRNPKNQPDAYESEVLRVLESGSQTEFWEIDKQTNKVRYFRPVKLTTECLVCHGNPDRSMELWGRDDGRDISGGKMENWKAGEIHGAFEVMMSMEPIDEAVAKKSFVIAGISLFSTGLIILLTVFVANGIRKPIKVLELSASKVAQGDVDVSVETLTNDEIGSLTNSFNQMVVNIKSAQEDLKAEKASVERKVEVAVAESEAARQYLARSTDVMLNAMQKFAKGDLTVTVNPERDDDIAKLFNGFNEAVNNIRNIVVMVTEAIDATASASTQISASTDQLAAGAHEQSAQTLEVASAVEQMAKTILETTSNATRASESARNSGVIAIEGGKVVSETINGMNKIAEVVTQAAYTVKDLGKSSDKIGEIVQVIDDIADQTNLLALNAAIEAARAGEQGRGFAVVADEVRKLAERTTKATKEIAIMIKQIQKETNEAVHSMEKGTDEVNSGKHLAQKAETALHQIINSSNEVVDNVAQVAAASEEQSSAAETISKNVEAISAVTNESAAGTQEIAKAAEDLSRLTDRLQNLVNQFHIGHHHSVGQVGQNKHTKMLS